MARGTAVTNTSTSDHASSRPMLRVADISVEISRNGTARNGTARNGTARNGTAARPVDGVSFDLAPGEILGLAGESGSGKTLTLRAIMGLLPKGANMTGAVELAPLDPTDAPLTGALGGRGVGMIFQEPFTALNPTMRVGNLIGEAVRSTDHVKGRAREARVLELMGQVGMSDPRGQSRMWPHQLSGGMRQRVMIAAALVARPRVLLCDEPTTALDVSVQDQILGLLADIRRDTGMSIVFVTHDLAVLGELCDRINVMYAGQLVETGPVADVFERPHHRYTEALLESVPSLSEKVDRLADVVGHPPNPSAFPPGCRFEPRCRHAQRDCVEPMTAGDRAR
ncbi:MAG: ABC transporter ATP-binding protein [Microthrixaceae bacterium]